MKPVVSSLLLAGLLAVSNLAYAGPKASLCKAYANGGGDRQSAILNRLTHSRRDDYNRNEMDIPYAFCTGDISLVNARVDQGDVSAREVETIARGMGVSYKARPRTPQGLLYEKTLNALNNRTEISEADAGGGAYMYAYRPKSECAKFVGSFLKRVVKVPPGGGFPDYCASAN